MLTLSHTFGDGVSTLWWDHFPSARGCTRPFHSAFTIHARGDFVLGILYTHLTFLFMSFFTFSFVLQHPAVNLSEGTRRRPHIERMADVADALPCTR